MVLSVSSSSRCLERAAVCDCGTPWTFFLPFFFLILKSFDKMIPHFRDSICYATRIKSIVDVDHICNGVKPQSFVFVCTEHLNCLTKIFGIGLNIIFAIAISAALEM